MEKNYCNKEVAEFWKDMDILFRIVRKTGKSIAAIYIKLYGIDGKSSYSLFVGLHSCIMNLAA